MIMIDSEECELSQILQHRPLKKQIRGLKHQISGQMDGICLQRRESESMIKHRAPDTLSNTGTKLLLNTQCKQLGLSLAVNLGWLVVVSLALPLGAEALIEVLLGPLPASSNANGSQHF